MMGKHHVQLNFGVLVSGLSVFGAGSCVPLSWLSDYCQSCLDALIPESVTYMGQWSNNMIIFLGMAVLFFWFGSLLPDIDNQNSYFGRYLYLPVGHRRITHTLWALGALSVTLGISVWFKYLWLGYFFHILGDAFSYAGVLWLYPLKQYKEYASGAFVAPGHVCKWYRAGKKSELRFVVLVMMHPLFAHIWFCFSRFFICMGMAVLLKQSLGNIIQ